MINEIYPSILHNEYVERKPENDDFIICFKDNSILVKKNDDTIIYPVLRDFKNVDVQYIYLFSVDNRKFFLCMNDNLDININDFSFENIHILRNAAFKDKAFAGVTAYHLYCWYRNNKYCGRCGHKLKHGTEERMLYCEECKNIVYPKIAPAVIVAVSHEDRLLITKYNGRSYKGYALVAGFIEIGETPEETVAREVMEEVGLKVKNIKYYKSQPWGFAENLLLGYFAELDGSSSITMDENELSQAEWVKRDEIEVEYDDISLTNEMICKFKNEL